MWVLGLYKLSWPANGSFVYVIIIYLFIFFLRGKTGNVKGERGS